eukprot:scaffold625_cov324-Pavlova_lutheri.AAC.27
MGVLLRAVFTLVHCGDGKTLPERPDLVLVQLTAVIRIIVKAFVPVPPNDIMLDLSRPTQGKAHMIETYVAVLHQCKPIRTHRYTSARIPCHCAPLNQTATPFNAYCCVTIRTVDLCVLKAKLAVHSGHRQKNT